MTGSGNIKWRQGRELLVALAALFALNSSLLTLSCANQVAPTGGPKDSLPPVVKSISPAAGGRHFTARRIFIEFDEYVQLRDRSKEFFTSPLMKTKPTLTIRGKGIRIDIKDTLPENQTFSLNFGSAIRDNNEGNPLSDFRYVFSTGAALDSLLATGYAADAMKGDSVSKAFIFFYDAALDTIPDYDSIVFKHRPSAVEKTKNNGIFVAQNLRDMRYRVYAIQDNNNNERYDPGTDKVGFLDSVINPATLPPTSIWHDQYRRYTTADPQMYFRLFGEQATRRQNLGGSERPGRHQVVLRFSAPHPRIDTLAFDGIPDDRIIREYPTVGRDTISLWFDVPSDMMPDTLRGRICYHKPDSLGNIVPASQALRLPWREVLSREQEREREKVQKERERAIERGETPPKEQNPFGFKVDASSEINPLKSIPINFNLPLSSLDSARISLTEVPESGDSSPVPFRVVRDTADIRRWVISADWDDTKAYRLSVPAGVFVNIAGERNDSLGADFRIVSRAEFATLAIKVVGKSLEAKYIVQLVEGKGKSEKVVRELRGVSTGEIVLDYVPAGEVRIRLTEDTNGNGRWDSGSLVDRRQPERVEFWVSPSGDPVLAAKANWRHDVTIDATRIFAPVTIEKITNDLRRAEDARVAKFLEAQAEKEAERRRRGATAEADGAGGLGIGSAMGGARQQIQSTVR